jgi:hypothetical protein
MAGSSGGCTCPLPGHGSVGVALPLARQYGCASAYGRLGSVLSASSAPLTPLATVSLLEGDRSVPLLSWPQGHTEEQRGEALKQITEAGVLPEDHGRLGIGAEGASWQGLDWAEATMTGCMWVK